MYFFAKDSLSRLQLWRSNGQAGGTFALTAGVNPANSRNYTSVQAVGSRFFFLAHTVPLGIELWTSDGTVAGTMKVKTIVGPPGSYCSIKRATIADKYLFTLCDNGSGYECWVSDGTELGTHILKDLSPGPEDTGLLFGGLLNGRICLFANPANAPTYQLWLTDGTTDGTTFVKNLQDYPSLLAVSGQRQYWLHKTFSDSLELWASDGTAGGTARVRTLGLSDYVLSGSGAATGNGTIAFSAIMNDDVPGLNDDFYVWQSDGTANGTHRVSGAAASIFLGSYPTSFTADGDGRVYFQAFRDSYYKAQVWKILPTSPLSAAMADLNAYDHLLGPLASDGKVFWLADKKLLISTNASGQYSEIQLPGTVQNEAAVFDGHFYFIGGDTTLALWRSDGTLAGTEPVAVQNAGSIFYNLHAVGDSLFWLQRFLIANKVAHLWRSDGTAAGTQDLGALPSDVQYNPHLYTADDRWALSWQDSLSRRGTMLQGFPPLAFESSDIAVGLAVLGDALVVAGPPVVYPGGFSFYLLHGQNGLLDTVAEFDRIGTYYPYDLSFTNALFALPGKVLFGAGSAADVELWQSDGSTAGTFLLKDINPNGSSLPQHFIRYDSLHWLFTAFDGALTAWWATDGTSGGTFKLADLPQPSPLPPNLALPNATEPFLQGNRLFFSMNDGVSGQEPWVLELPDSLVTGLALRPVAVSGSMAIWPNPATETLQIALEQFPPGTLHVEVYDVRGALVQEEKVAWQAGATALTIRLGNVKPDGAYFVKITGADGERAAGRFLIKR